MTSPRILIVGGGIGGLTLATALSRRGIACDLIERSAAWAPVGAGITLGVNATRILGELGLLERARECSRVIDRAAITDTEGNALSTAEFSRAFEGIGVSLAIHRADLHAVLVSGCERASIRMGTTLRSMEQDGRAAVVFSDGSEGEYDLVVGADGIRSQVRELNFPPVETRYSGYACWRFIVQARIEPPSMYEMWGRGRRFGIVPLTGDKVYAFATINTPAGNATFAGMTGPEFARLYHDFGGPARAVLEAVGPETKLIYGDLEEVRIPEWIQGRAVLLGDAAHAMTPNMGQGAAMAIEDAFGLGEAIAAAGEKLPETELGAWQSRRRPRVDRIQGMSWNQGRVAQHENPLVCGARNLALRLAPDRLVMNNIKRLLLEAW